jgi:hypothetical protein
LDSRPLSSPACRYCAALVHCPKHFLVKSDLGSVTEMPHLVTLLDFGDTTRKSQTSPWKGHSVVFQSGNLMTYTTCLLRPYLQQREGCKKGQICHRFSDEVLSLYLGWGSELYGTHLVRIKLSKTYLFGLGKRETMYIDLCPLLLI